jgi:hypothetical protein
MEKNDKEDESWLELELTEIAFERAARQIRETPTENLCGLLQKDQYVLELYHDDVDFAFLTQPEYTRMRGHFDGCYCCREAFVTYLNSIPRELRRFGRQE